MIATLRRVFSLRCRGRRVMRLVMYVADTPTPYICLHQGTMIGVLALIVLMWWLV